MRLVAGGDTLSYYEDTRSPSASIWETKLLINTVISDANKGARFALFNLTYFSWQQQ